MTNNIGNTARFDTSIFSCNEMDSTKIPAEDKRSPMYAKFHEILEVQKLHD